MKLKKFKEVLKNENKPSGNMGTNTNEIVAERLQYNSDAKKLISLERLQSSDYRKLQSSQNSRNAAFKKKYDVEIEKGSKVISYVPKHNVRFIPSDIKSYGNNQNLDFSKTNFNNFAYNKMPEFYSISNMNSNNQNHNNNNNNFNSFIPNSNNNIFNSSNGFFNNNNTNNNYESNNVFCANENSDSPKAKTQNNFFKFNKNNNNNNINISNAINNIDMDYLNFKTNFLLRFTKNINNYTKILQIIETLVHQNKRYFYTCMEKLKILSEKKDKILLEINQKLSNLSTWKETVIFVFEFESLWQKLSEALLKELKKALDANIILQKKNMDQEEELALRSKKIEELNEFIRINDIHTKITKYNKTLEMVNDVKVQYEKKGNKTLIEMFNMENQILDLTSLLDKDKKYMHKYLESLELLETKKKELEEVRLKLNQDIEEKKIKISQITLEKHEFHLKNIELQKEIEELNELQKQTKTDHIEFHTQIKILKQTLQEKDENIEMLANEVETWMSELYKERVLHYNAEQTVSALEFKISSIKR